MLWNHKRNETCSKISNSVKTKGIFKPPIGWLFKHWTNSLFTAILWLTLVKYFYQHSPGFKSYRGLKWPWNVALKAPDQPVATTPTQCCVTVSMCHCHSSHWWGWGGTSHQSVWPSVGRPPPSPPLTRSCHSLTAPERPCVFCLPSSLPLLHRSAPPGPKVKVQPAAAGERNSSATYGGKLACSLSRLPAVQQMHPPPSTFVYQVVSQNLGAA